MNPVAMRALTAAAAAWEMDVNSILTGKRLRSAYEPRAAAMLILNSRPAWYISRIGREFGMNHGGVIYAIKRAKDMVDTEPAFAARAARARELFDGDDESRLPVELAPKVSTTWELRYPDPEFPGQIATARGEPACIIAHILRVCGSGAKAAV